MTDEVFLTDTKPQSETQLSRKRRKRESSAHEARNPRIDLSGAAIAQRVASDIERWTHSARAWRLVMR